MKKQTLSRMFAMVTLGLAMFLLPSARVAEDLTITIQVSPNVLNLLNQGEVVTVHTDIAYGLVLGASVTINGLPIAWWKSDDRGNFVAKFNMVEVKKLNLTPGSYNLLTLTGETINGQTFIGQQEIKVVYNLPSKK